MNNEFPRVLALLRKERGLSQKVVAGELGISQALLSHYEKGAREPGLDFLCKAASFYNVSVDYLLGRSSERRPGEELPDVQQAPDNSLRGRNVFSALGKNLTVSAVNVLFGLMEMEQTKGVCRLCAAVSGHFHLQGLPPPDHGKPRPSAGAVFAARDGLS